MRRRYWIALTLALVLADTCCRKLESAETSDLLLTTEVAPVEVQLFIPRQAQTIRGVIVHAANYKLAADDRWAELCRQLRFAHVAMNIPNVQKATSRGQKLSKALDEGLKEFAVKSGHAELPSAPLVGAGHSAGGLVTQVLFREPERTITYCVDCSWVVDPTKVTAEAKQVPALFTMGAIPDDFKMLPSIDERFVPARKAGSPWGLGIQWECAHDFGNSAALMLPWIQAVTTRRLPAEPPTEIKSPRLRDLKLEDGWLGDRATIDSHFASIAPWNEYAGDKSTAAWFPNRAVAYVWRAWQAHGSPITLEASANAGRDKLPPWQPKKSRDLFLEPNVDLTLTASVKPGITVKNVVYYDQDQLLGAGNATDAWRWEWQKPAPGIHVVYAQWETADGQHGVSNPALIIVRMK